MLRFATPHLRWFTNANNTMVFILTNRFETRVEAKRVIRDAGAGNLGFRHTTLETTRQRLLV